MALEIKDSNFEELLASGKPVVVDFWATWCGPCKKIAPDVEALAEEYKDQVIIGKCDVDDNDELTGKFGVRNIPTVLFIKDGEVKDKTVGAVTKAQLEEKIKALLTIILYCRISRCLKYHPDDIDIYIGYWNNLTKDFN